MIRRFAPILAAIIGLAPTVESFADTVYFVSKTTGGLYTFDSAVGAIAPLANAGPGTFNSPSALAMGSDGNLYVGDATGGGSILRYVLSSGSIASVVSLNGSGPVFSGSPVNPGTIAFTPGGAMLVGRNPEVAFFPGSYEAWPGGAVLNIGGWRSGETPSISAYTTGTAQDYSPGLAVSPDGTLYVSNAFYDAATFAMTGNVLAFDASGANPTESAADNSFGGGLFGPAGLVVTGNSLYIASTMDGNIYKTDLTNPNTATNTSVFGSTDGDYIGPLSLLSNGSLLVGSVASSGSMYLFDATGDLVETFGGSGYGAIGGIVAVPEPTAVCLGAVGIALVGLARLRGRLRRRA